MDDRPVIAAFDCATSTGVAWGRVGLKPDVATWNMREAGPYRPARLSNFFDRLHELFANYQINQVWYEAPLGLASLNKIGASEDTIAILRGLVGVLELVAWRSGIRSIQSFTAQSARKHLVGRGTFSEKGEGKAEVMRVAKMLGVEVTNDNEGDAYAGWSYACGLANPRLAHLVTPLFAPTQ